MHLGHQVLFDSFLTRTADHGGFPMVITFEPHPTEVLRPHAAPSRILPLHDKLRIFEKLGIEVAVVIPFTKAFASITPAAFVEDVLVGTLGVRDFLLGPDSRFGSGALGSLSLMKSLAERHGFEVSSIQPLVIDGRTVSSSLIRRLVAEGDVEAATRCLGRHYRLKGEVIHGNHQGRRLGFPTANVRHDKLLVPAEGVYFGRTWHQGSLYRSLVSVGTRPTFRGKHLLIETHLIDFSGDLYGATVSVEFVKRVRGQVRFSSTTALVEQMQRDLTEVSDL